MPDWSSPVISHKLVDACEIIKWLLVGVLLLDHVEKAPFDWSIISGKRARRWPQLFYFGAKFFWYVFLCLHILLIKSETKINCQWLAYALEATMAVVNVCCSILLACRVTCIFPQGRSHLVISIVLGIASLALAGIWLAGSADITATWVDGGGAAWTEGGCHPVTITREFSIKFVAIVIFDFFVLVMTIVGIMRISTKGTTRLGSILFSQGVFYFSITAAVNLVTCILVLMQLSPLMSIAGAVPSAAISVFASTRLYVDLAQVAIPAHGTIELSERSQRSGFKEKLGSFLPGSPSKGSSQTLTDSADSKGQFNSLSSQTAYSPEMPYSNTVSLPTSPPPKRALNKVSSDQDLESQIDSDQIEDGDSSGHPYSFSKKTNSNGTTQQEPVALASSGIPAFPTSSTSSPLHPRQRQHDYGHYEASKPAQREGQGQGLGVTVQRTQEVRNEVVPSSLNFVIGSNEQADDEEYKGLGGRN